MNEGAAPTRTLPGEPALGLGLQVLFTLLPPELETSRYTHGAQSNMNRPPLPRKGEKQRQNYGEKKNDRESYTYAMKEKGKHRVSLVHRK